MSVSGPLQPPTALLDTTMDQLRTLIAVRETGTALRAARLLGREQSSVQKQIDTLNRNFGSLCGEPLVLKQGRGRDVLFTATGQALADLARDTLGHWLDGIQESRRRLGGTLAVGSTRYTLGYLVDAVEEVTEEFERNGTELKVSHVRTADLLRKLDDKELDLVCGSVLSGADGDEHLERYDVMEWRRSGLSLVTNLPEDALPGPSAPTGRLSALPLVVSGSGLIAGFLRGWFGAGYRDKLNIAAEIDAAQYGFDLLRSGVLRGCMLVTRGIGEAIDDGAVPEARGLRTVDLLHDVGPELEVLVGAFTRRGERASYGPGHPVNLLWNALAAENERRLGDHGGPAAATGSVRTTVTRLPSR